METSLTDIIKNKIKKHGPISFHDFMEMALYYLELGYYTSSPDKIGKRGDYYTSPYFSDVFGNVIAKQLEEMWLLTGKKDFTIVEYGAGMGSLCIDILNELKLNKALFESIKYCIIEKSEAMRLKQKKIIDHNLLTEKICWYDSIDNIPPFTGCVLANEVLDNFAVHKVVMKENELKEVFVDHENGFVEILKPAGDVLKDYFIALDIELPNEFCTEVNLEAIEWIKTISSSLEKGFVLTIDYGYPSSELYQSHHRLGTIVCYNKHTVNDLPYENIGQQDITAHVNFSALKFWGTKHGLNNCGFTDQSRFLLGLGLTEHLRRLEEQQTYNFEIRRKLTALHTFLISMGRKFKVLVQQKGLNRPFLSGLQFCQPLR